MAGSGQDFDQEALGPEQAFKLGIIGRRKYVQDNVLGAAGDRRPGQVGHAPGEGRMGTGSDFNGVFADVKAQAQRGEAVLG
jgi:hypothetical protein